MNFAPYWFVALDTPSKIYPLSGPYEDEQAARAAIPKTEQRYSADSDFKVSESGLVRALTIPFESPDSAAKLPRYGFLGDA